MTALALPAADTLPLHTDPDGVIRVGGTRISLDTIVVEWQQGATREQIAQDYDSLSMRDIDAAIGYYLSHRREVEDYLARERQRAEDVRRQDEARFPPDGIRQRLLARRHEKVRHLPLR